MTKKQRVAKLAAKIKRDGIDNDFIAGTRTLKDGRLRVYLWADHPVTAIIFRMADKEGVTADVFVENVLRRGIAKGLAERARARRARKARSTPRSARKRA